MKTAAVIRFSLTALIVVVAALLAHALWQHYMRSPWTRDGRVRAEVVRVAPDVAGPVLAVPVKDNQRVAKGEVLFVIDPTRFEYAVAEAEANLQAAQAAARMAGASISAATAGTAASQAEFEKYRAQAQRRERAAAVVSAEARANAAATALSAQAEVRRAQAGRSQAGAGQQQAVAAVAQAQVALDLARLNLARSQVRAPIAGYVTNLNVRSGDFAAAGTPRLALVSDEGLWVYGYFEETKLPFLRVGDPAEIRLMSGGASLRGRVDSIAHGITDRDNPVDGDLLANVSPTFNWIRLAQRVPVRIRIDEASVPADEVLASGMTVTVVVHPRAREPARSRLRT